ncbi:MAG: N-acetylglucosamine kinase [Bacteroidota bacterium]
MTKQVLIIDSGATKAEWVLLSGPKTKRAETAGISPYFMDGPSIILMVKDQLKPPFLRADIAEIHFYGTGCAARSNALLVKKSLGTIWPKALITVSDDLLGATRALCGHEPGIACILGTGSSSAEYNGKKITQQRPGLGYALGDEGSGAYLGKKLIQYFLYDLLDKELQEKFRKKYKMDRADILDAVYKKPSPSRFLASFTPFLSANRGHYMIENILEDGFQDFFFHHIRRYKQADRVPIHFTGSVAYVFRDWIRFQCQNHGYTIGQILPKPMPGLIRYHK